MSEILNDVALKSVISGVTRGIYTACVQEALMNHGVESACRIYGYTTDESL